MSKALDLTTAKFSHPTTALLLGSGELGKEVAIELMRYGIKVIACDRYDNAPAMQVASAKAVLNMKDREALLNLIHQVKPDVVIPEIEAIATEVLLQLEQNEGLRVVPSANAANITMNREAIRTLAANTLNLPTSPFFFASSEEEIRENIDKVGFPCIMKPIMSSSGKGQSTLKSEKDIEEAWQKACTEGRGHENRVIVEGFVKFDREITLLTIHAVDGIHFCEPIGHHQVNGDYHESWQPEPLDDDILIECKRIASTVVKALGGFGIFGVELFIAGRNVIFSELSPRPHDTGMVTMISQDLSEFALHVRALLGLPIGEEIAFHGPSASAALLGEGKGNKISYKNIDKALALGKNTAVRIFGKPDIDGERRLGVALARAASVKEAVELVKSMRDTIEIVIEDEQQETSGKEE
ncbi:MAG: formate-dependent phosphoribosylglycinamide formyltransferase [Proteobacteria bacterium]|uniref:Formate-dependent phosphoribosylglycinamide formyltransferase n=1 Tax=Candidatus Avisuccinivibrio stercorigallinarum TaxID=2840704 RepID=A0A9D9D9P0_9GAMM|nr:formate-dependent phosphoribosylglycinamide formyltransferase [Candidatus Avisuccinivibrio stercorigallinarum]